MSDQRERPCLVCFGSGRRTGTRGSVTPEACDECVGRGTRHVRAGIVVRGDVVLLPNRSGTGRVAIEVVRATQGYRRQDEGKPDAERQRRRLEGRPALHPRAEVRTWLRPFAERLEVVRLVTDA